MPIVCPNVFHGTLKDFAVFMPTKNKPRLQYGFGIHFTVDPEFAEFYATNQKNGQRGRIIEAQISFQRLWDATRIIQTNEPEFRVIQALCKGTGRRPYICNGQISMNIELFDNRRIQRVLREHGYDGIKYRARIVDGMYKIAEAISYVVFEPEQVSVRGEVKASERRALPLSEQSESEFEVSVSP